MDGPAKIHGLSGFSNASNPEPMQLTMNRARILAIGAALTLFPCTGMAQSGNLNAVLAQMDASSKNFQKAEASIKREQYDRLVHDTTTQTGSIYFLRTGNSIQMGLKLDDGTVMEYKTGTLRVYQAGPNHVETHAASGADQARFQTYLTLGFGGSGSDLAKAWNINDQGSETIDGVKVDKLDLVSKDPSVKANYSHITMWVDPARDVSLKLETFDPAGNTNTATYSNIRYNEPIKDLASYAIKCKGKCD
jgi:outer membrane lipoprotein-sorting protein